MHGSMGCNDRSQLIQILGVALAGKTVARKMSSQWDANGGQDISVSRVLVSEPCAW